MGTGPIDILFLDVDGVLNTARGEICGGRFGRRWVLLDRVRYRIRRSLRNVLEFTWLHRYPMLRFYYFLYLVPKDTEGFDKYSFYWLRKILEEKPDTHIVVSSIWRYDGLYWMQKLLQRFGIPSDRVIGCTPITREGARGLEIQMWLKGWELSPYGMMAKTMKLPPHLSHEKHRNVRRIVIWDDDADMEPYMERLVRTDAHDGVCFRDYLKTLELLEK